MPLPIPEKTNKTPIATVLKWYFERKKGKVAEARKEIQRRFEGLDWKDQKKIILAFLSSGKADREWAYKRLIRYWDNDFLPKVKEIFERYHEEKCFIPVIWFFPTSYILSHIDEFISQRYYYKLCYRLAYDHVDFNPERQKLTPKEYLTIIKMMNKTLDDSDAIDILYKVLHDLSTNRYSKYNGVSYGHIVPKGYPLVASDFVYVYVLIQKLKNLNCKRAMENFSIWETNLYWTINNSQEFKALNEKSPLDYNERRIIITKDYIYQTLPEKYKSPSDETPFASDLELFQKMKEENPSVSLLSDNFGLELLDR